MSEQLAVTIEVQAQAGEHRALDAALGEFWAITPRMLETILMVAARENVGPEAIAAREGTELDNTQTMTIRDGIAAIPIRGPMFRYANLFTRLSGATSMEVAATDFSAALGNPEVRAIILEVDSPGGTVNGTQELAQLIFEGRGVKPIVAHISGDGNSAAYWVASAADEVVLGPTALAGSIGVVATFVDTKEAERKAGIRTIEIISSQSPAKHPDPATSDGRAQIQAIVDRLGEEFVAAVARNRAADVETVLMDFGAGDVRVGEDAVTAGLADRVATFEQLHQELAAIEDDTEMAGLSFAADAATTTEGESAMADDSAASPAAEPKRLTADEIKTQYPEAVAAFRREGAEAENTRLLGIEALAPGDADVMTACKQDLDCTVEAAAFKLRQKEVKDADGRQQARATEEEDPKPEPLAADATDPENAGTFVSNILALDKRLRATSAPN